MSIFGAYTEYKNNLFLNCIEIIDDNRRNFFFILKKYCKSKELLDLIEGVSVV